MLSDEFTKVQAELEAIFAQLQNTRDPSERKLLFADVGMLLQLASRLIKESDERVKKLREQRPGHLPLQYQKQNRKNSTMK